LAAMRSCCLAVMLSCCLAVMLSCCHVVLLSCCHVVLLSCCFFAVILSFCCHAVMLSCCLFAVVLSCCHAVMLSCGLPLPHCLGFSSLSSLLWESHVFGYGPGQPKHRNVFQSAEVGVRDFEHQFRPCFQVYRTRIWSYPFSFPRRRREIF